MSEPIKVGDLVMVVRGHSCAMEQIGGVPFTVTDILPQVGGGWTCNICGTRNIAPEALYAAVGAPKPRAKLLKMSRVVPGGMPLQWLKRIQPLGDLNDEKRREEIVA